ncbi:MAG: phosphotransferase [Treponema sp.]|nr:phosphotransferase [Treponema sp.]
MKQIGKGLTAEVFELSEDKVIKLFNKGYPKQAIRREFRNARLVNSFKINGPQAFEMKEVDGRTGIVYGYVKGQCIESVFDSGVDLERNLQAFCQLQKSFYNHKKLFMLDYKTYGRALVAGKVSDKKEASEYLRFINSFPNANTVVHGDFHPLNVFVEQDGGLKVIDFMNMMRSPAEYDIARTYFLIGAVSADFAEAYLSVMGYTADEISGYVELVKLYRKLEG